MNILTTSMVFFVTVGAIMAGIIFVAFGLIFGSIWEIIFGVILMLVGGYATKGLFDKQD